MHLYTEYTNPNNKKNIAKAVEKEAPKRRAFVFERLGHTYASTLKRIVTDQKILVIFANTTALLTAPFMLGRNDHEASSFGGKLMRRQRRRMNSEL